MRDLTHCSSRPAGRTRPSDLRAWVALAAFVSGVPRAWAQPAPAETSPPMDEARVYYEQGLVALAENRYHDAAVALERSSRLRALPVVTYNLALAYRGLGRYVAAIESFEQYLRRPEPTAPAERLTAIQQELRELRARLVRVTVRLRPPEATLQLDGRPTSPASGEIVLDPGAHTFEWSLEGHLPERREIAGVAGSSPEFEINLRPRQEGRLVVETPLSNAAVLVDGRAVGSGRFEGPLPPGEHQVEIRAPRYVPWRRPVRIGPVGVVRIDAVLVREPWPSWVLPTAIGVGVAVVTGVVLGLVVNHNNNVPPPYRGTWGSEQER